MLTRRTFCTALLMVIGFGKATSAAEPVIISSNPPPAHVDLRPEFERWGLPGRNQGSRPTCSVFTFAGALEFAQARANHRGERLSVEYLNWAANQTGRPARDGGFFSELWQGFGSHGICAETNLPYKAEFDLQRAPDANIQAEARTKLKLNLRLHWIKRWNVNTGLSNHEFEQLKQTLKRGWPVCGGFRWPKADIWKNDVLQMCPPEDVMDGHSVLLVGYRDDPAQPDGGWFIFRNTNRGGHDGYMPYRYAKAYLNDAVWIEAKTEASQPR